MSSEGHSNEVLVPQARDAAASQAYVERDGEASESEEDEAPKRSPTRRLVNQIEQSSSSAAEAHEGERRRAASIEQQAPEDASDDEEMEESGEQSYVPPSTSGAPEDHELAESAESEDVSIEE